LLSHDDEVARFENAGCDLVVAQLAVAVASFLVEEVKQLLLVAKEWDCGVDVVQCVLSFEWYPYWRGVGGEVDGKGK
jgi:hypothetical protein